jgi:hypothetical protein
MLGNLSDDEANKLIAYISKSMISNITIRDAALESKIFPVMHYINTACYILYDQSYQFNVLRKVARKISPETIAKRSKTLCAPLNQLAFYSIAMLYLQGRAAVIHDNYYKKKTNPNIVIEPENKKIETKFILDFWRRLSPNYRNDGALTVENKEIVFLSDEYINILRDQMIPINNKTEIIKKLRQTIAQLTIFNFLFQGECRAGISEHGPYYFEGSSDALIFKEFQYLYVGKEIFGMDISSYLPQKITKLSPIPNVIFGLTLKNMNKIEFNDWSTLFADPSDFSSNITSIGIWTKELIHPKYLRYPDNMGKLKPLSLNILDDLNDFAKNATKELYIQYSKWNFIKKLMLGTSLYANNCAALCASYAGIENDFDWTWPNDYVLDKPFKTELLNKEKITSYINHLKRWNGGHPFMQRVLRGRKIQKTDPFYYYLQD